MNLVLLIVGSILILLGGLQVSLWTAASVRGQWAQAEMLKLSQEKLRAEIQAIVKLQASPTPQNAWNGYRRFVVARLEQENQHTMSVYLQAQDQRPLPSFLPGQHLTLRFQPPTQPNPVTRCYSLSQGPDPQYYRITVKAAPPKPSAKLPHGLASTFINRSLAVGDVVDAKAPAGSFHLDTTQETPVVLLAGGIGITPMMSMIETLLAAGSRREILLVYGVQNSADHTFKERLAQVALANPNLNVLTCYSKPSPNDRLGRDYQIAGRVTIDLLKRGLPSSNFDFYLCGPGPFMASLYAGLRDWDVSEERIYFEAFGPATIKRSKTTTPEKGDTPDTEGRAATTTSCDIHFQRSQQTVTFKPTMDSILDAAETAKVVMESGCRAGSCGTCQVRLLAGAVGYPNSQPRDSAEGMCLPCVAVPVTAVTLDA